jgi:hypothetical protein
VASKRIACCSDITRECVAAIWRESVFQLYDERVCCSDMTRVCCSEEIGCSAGDGEIEQIEMRVVVVGTTCFVRHG